MIILSFKTKEDKEMLLEKAKKMEKYASMIVDCIEESDDYDDSDYEYRNYRHESPEYFGRYGYKRRMK